MLSSVTRHQVSWIYSKIFLKLLYKVEIIFARDRMKTDDKNIYFRNLRKLFSKLSHSYAECLISIREGRTSVPLSHYDPRSASFLFHDE